MRKIALMERLAAIHGDPEIFLASDAEGNDCALLADVESSPLDNEGEPCHPDDADDDCESAIVLWPK